MKVGIAGFGHETVSFWPGLTDLNDFERNAKHGNEVLQMRNTNSSMGGFIEICEEQGVEIFPICHAFGGATATVADEVYDFYVGKMKNEFNKMAEKIDGILLAMHGAMATESRQDPETDAVREIREIVGYKIPIMVAFDLHANKGFKVLKEATAIFGYHSSPHVDMAETGRRAAKALLSTIKGELIPTMAMSKPGIAGATVFSATSIPPMKDLIFRLHEWEKQRKVIDVSVFFGFPWSDVEQIGMSMIAVTDDDAQLAQDIVDDLASLAWKHRDSLTGRGKSALYNVEDGVKISIQKSKQTSRPIIILDFADRTGDTTWVLRELLLQGAENAAVPCFYSPEAVIKCFEKELGQDIKIKVGGNTGWLDGGPLKVHGKLLWKGMGEYVGTGPMTKNKQIDLGKTAIIKVNGVWLQLISQKTQLIDEDPFKQFGYNTKDFTIIVSKSKTHFREVYEKIGEEIIVIDAPGQAGANLSNFIYKNVPLNVYNITAY